MEGLELPFYNSTPCVLGSPSFPLFLWCSVMGFAGDVAWLSSHHISNSCPSPSHDDSAHAVLVTVGEMLVGDALGPQCSQYPSKVLGVEGG